MPISKINSMIIEDNSGLDIGRAKVIIFEILLPIQVVKY